MSAILTERLPEATATPRPMPRVQQQTYRIPPPLDDLAAERLFRKQRLAASYRLFARYGFDMGGAGHITVRDPQWPDHFWVNRAGQYFGSVRVSELVMVNHHGDIVEGEGPINTAGFAIHSELHKARPDVLGAAHSHSLHGKAWSSLGRLLDPLTQDSAAFFEDHALYDEFHGVVLEPGEGQRIAQTLGTRKAIILRNHGLLTVGTRIESAVWWYIAMENAAHAQLLAEAASAPRPMDVETARFTATQMGSELGGYYSFQPLYASIIREQPDFLE